MMKELISETLQAKWEKFKAENPSVRIRDAAAHLGVSEAELVAISDRVTRLRPEFSEIFGELKKLGYVMALTRNEEIVHERKGVYENPEIFSGHNMALFVNTDIDLRIFMSNWHSAFAVTSESPRGEMRSLQFFDSDGTAVHKIFLTETSDLAAYEALVSQFDDQSASLEVAPKPPKEADKPDAEIDIEGFRDGWKNLKDTHDFFPLMRKFGVGREQALRLADPEMARKVHVNTYQKMLRLAAERKLPIMVFVGNAGIIQIHTGEVENVLEARGWFNVMDEKFNLHIDQENIASCWLVRKPTSDGIVTSLELFNARSENVALFFGKRKPGSPELEEWRELVANLAVNY